MDKLDKAFEIQRQARDNAKVLRSYLTDLENWETEMKRKEAAVNGDYEQDLPPVRSKIRKDKPVQLKKKMEKKISGVDYQAWEKFDADKACEEVDLMDKGPVSLDSKKSEQVKKDKLVEEAQYEKDRGNNFVKQKKWDEAIACYNRAIELVKNDPIYYANRGLCYLKKESLHQAESDCTEALRLDPTYVKALQRRATAREKLGSLKAASNDLNEVIKLEPRNMAALVQLNQIKARMGTKGAKYKSSPSPTTENKSIAVSKEQERKIQPKISNEVNKNTEIAVSPMQKWRDGIGENVTVIKPVKKPVHLRSKRAMKHITIQEIPLGKSSPEKVRMPMKIIEIEDSVSVVYSNNNDSNRISGDVEEKTIVKGDGDVKHCAESDKLIKDTLIMETNVCPENMVPPLSSVQFMAEWKGLKGQGKVKAHYLNIIDPSKIPLIFANALESDILSEILSALCEYREMFREKTTAAYLRGLSRVKRFSALAMFLSSSDREVLTKLLDHCKTVEGCSDEDVADLKNKYEL